MGPVVAAFTNDALVDLDGASVVDHDRAQRLDVTAAGELSGRRQRISAFLRLLISPENIRCALRRR
jgi:hypothetical protein